MAAVDTPRFRQDVYERAGPPPAPVPRRMGPEWKVYASGPPRPEPYAPAPRPVRP